MKSLSQHINEQFSHINEAFDSSIIKNLYDENQKIFKRAINAYRVKWSDIKDSDVQTVDISKAKKLAKSSDSKTLLIWMSGESLLGLSYGSYGLTTDRYTKYNSRGFAGYTQRYSNIAQISKAADNAYYINADGLDTSVLRDERWASRQGALAYESNYSIAEQNKHRYKKIIANNMANRLNDPKIDDMVKNAMIKYGEIFQKLQGDADWYSIKNLGNEVKTLLENYFEYSKLVTQAQDGTLYPHQLSNITKSVDEINKVCDKVLEQNEEFED
jgi:hypothetical protein